MVIYQMRIWLSLGEMEASMDEVVIMPFDLKSNFEFCQIRISNDLNLDFGVGGDPKKGGLRGGRARGTNTPGGGAGYVFNK